MLVVRCTLLSSHPFHLLVNKTPKRSTTTTTASANRKNVPGEAKPKVFKFPLKFVAQSAIAVFALGFIDAGYSGDWSRVGVISKSDEDFLKYAAFIVVPLCIFFLLSFNKKSDD